MNTLKFKKTEMEIKNKGLAVYVPILLAVAVILGILVGRYYNGSNAENKSVSYTHLTLPTNREV